VDAAIEAAAAFRARSAHRGPGAIAA